MSWHGAKAFAEWIGARLPTEAEWEYAARSGGRKDRKYPWGNEFDATKVNADGEADGFVYTAPVGSFPANDWGLHDMAGNVWEWCSSLYKSYPYDADDGREDLQESGTRVVRGGAFLFNLGGVRCSNRSGLNPSYWNDFSGFRVVASP